MGAGSSIGSDTLERLKAAEQAKTAAHQTELRQMLIHAYELLPDAIKGAYAEDRQAFGVLLKQRNARVAATAAKIEGEMMTDPHVADLCKSESVRASFGKTAREAAKNAIRTMNRSAYHYDSRDYDPDRDRLLGQNPMQDPAFKQARNNLHAVISNFATVESPERAPIAELALRFESAKQNYAMEMRHCAMANTDPIERKIIDFVAKTLTVIAEPKYLTVPPVTEL